MFTIDSNAVMWEVHIFFTGSFFWVETRDTRGVANNRWHAPLFIGVDSPPRFSFMNDFINRSLQAKLIFGDPNPSTTFTMPEEIGIYRSLQAKLIFGDPNPSTTFTMPEEIGIYEFKYSELRSRLNNEFSKDN